MRAYTRSTYQEPAALAVNCGLRAALGECSGRQGGAVRAKWRAEVNSFEMSIVDAPGTSENADVLLGKPWNSAALQIYLINLRYGIYFMDAT